MWPSTRCWPGAPQRMCKARTNSSSTELWLKEQWANFFLFNCIFPRFLRVFMLFCQKQFPKSLSLSGKRKKKSFSLVAFPSVHTGSFSKGGWHPAQREGRPSPRGSTWRDSGVDPGGTAWVAEPAQRPLPDRCRGSDVHLWAVTANDNPNLRAIRTLARRLLHFVLS